MAIYVPTEFFEQINKMLFLPQCARGFEKSPCLTSPVIRAVLLDTEAAD